MEAVNMADTKETGEHHLEDGRKRASLEQVLQEERDVDELQEKYHVPVREVLQDHLDEDPAMVRKIMRKVDLRLVPMLSLLYMWAFIDRSNLGNVREPTAIDVLRCCIS